MVFEEPQLAEAAFWQTGWVESGSKPVLLSNRPLCRLSEPERAAAVALRPCRAPGGRGESGAAIWRCFGRSPGDLTRSVGGCAGHQPRPARARRLFHGCPERHEAPELSAPWREQPEGVGGAGMASSTRGVGILWTYCRVHIGQSGPSRSPRLSLLQEERPCHACGPGPRAVRFDMRTGSTCPMWRWRPTARL